MMLEFTMEDHASSFGWSHNLRDGLDYFEPLLLLPFAPLIGNNNIHSREAGLVGLSFV